MALQALLVGSSGSILNCIALSAATPLMHPNTSILLGGTSIGFALQIEILAEFRPAFGGPS